MCDTDKAIKYFTSLRKTYLELQNEEMLNIIDDALEALYHRKAQENYAIKMFGNSKKGVIYEENNTTKSYSTAKPNKTKKQF